jgi:hypothetical protein
MDESTRYQQEDIQSAHRDRARAEVGAEAEPLYGLAAIAGGHGEQPVEQSPEDELEAEGGRPGAETGINMTWGLLLGGVMILAIITVILYFGVGQTYSANIVTNYPVK